MRSSITAALCWALLALITAVGTPACRAPEKAPTAARLHKYFEGYAKSHSDWNVPNVRFQVAETGKIPDSPFSLFDIRVTSGDHHTVGSMKVVTDGKYMFPGNTPIVDLDSSREIVQNFLARESRLAIDPKPLFLVGGNPGADIKVVFFSDYESAECKEFAEKTLPGLLARKDVAVYHYELPLTAVHPRAELLARLAISYRRLTGGREVPPEFYMKKSSELESYLESFVGPMKNLVRQKAEAEETKAELKESMDLASRLGIDGVPTVLVNGYRSNPTISDISELIGAIENKEL